MAQVKYREPILHVVANACRIERTKDAKSGREEIRLCSGANAMDLSEQELLAMLGPAIEQKVFTPKFLDGLRKALGDRRVSRQPPADGPF